MNIQVINKTTQELIETIFVEGKHVLKTLQRDYQDCYFLRNGKRITV